MDITLPPKCPSGMDGLISQIPGLSPTIRTPTEGRAQGRRSRVHESDSDYIKLAKQGGHKGLLWHEDTVTAKAASYKPPDWFYTASEPESSPGKEKENIASFVPLEPPFGNDSMSAWERDDGSSNGNEKNNHSRDTETVAFRSTSQHDQPTKFKRVALDKKQSPPEMSKLLSHGYAEDDKAQVKTNLQGKMNGQISQIPGLSPVVIIPPEEKTQRRRGIVKESDSEYIKLAKQGGHKGLLWHEDTVTPSVTQYKPPDWFIPTPVTDSSPSKERKGPGGFLPMEPPFGNDNLSAWERDNIISNGNERKNSGRSRKTVTFQPIIQQDQTPTFKRLVKRTSPVDMAKLLSFGYAESEKPKTDANTQDRQD